jgi:hypothetical protein
MSFLAWLWQSPFPPLDTTRMRYVAPDQFAKKLSRGGKGLCHSQARNDIQEHYVVLQYSSLRSVIGVVRGGEKIQRGCVTSLPINSQRSLDRVRIVEDLMISSQPLPWRGISSLLRPEIALVSPAMQQSLTFSGRTRFGAASDPINSQRSLDRVRIVEDLMISSQPLCTQDRTPHQPAGRMLGLDRDPGVAFPRC